MAIASAERPVIVAGGGVLDFRRMEELTSLAERLNIPVATSINGKGSIAETSPVSIGVIGGNGARAYANACLADADLVLYIGSRTDSTTTCHWTLPDIERPPRVIQIDVAPIRDWQQLPAGRRAHRRRETRAGGSASKRSTIPQGVLNETDQSLATASGARSLLGGRRSTSGDAVPPIKPAQVLRAMRARAEMTR